MFSDLLELREWQTQNVADFYNRLKPFSNEVKREQALFVAQELSKIQELDKVTSAQKKKLELFDILKSGISDRKKLISLIELIGLEPDVYIERFEVNMDLLTKNDDLIKRL
jgi:hypothetical protein